MINEIMPTKGPSKIDLKKIAGLSSLVLMLPSSIAVGLLIGYHLDKWLKTDPWLLITFLLLGIVSGFYSLLRGLNKYKDI
jgi:ATP synthase protein I